MVKKLVGFEFFYSTQREHYPTMSLMLTGGIIYVALEQPEDCVYFYISMRD